MRAKVSSWVVSVGAHAAAIALLFFGLPYFQKPIQAEEKFTGIEVLLLASAPPEVPQPVVEQTPPPPPPPPVKEEPLITSTSQEPDLEPAPPPKPKPEVRRPPKPQPPKEQPKPVEKPVEMPVAPAPPVVAAAPAAPPAPVSSAPRLQVNPDAEASYYALISAILEKHKVYPRRAAMRRSEGLVYLSFTIDDQGRLMRYKIVRSSGHEALDNAVEELIQKVAPLPPIPAALNKSTVELVVPINYTLK